ncbi:nucleotidyltransferase family protein [Alloprevotella sp. OH1205_COT-284]|uniref:nucleotidyltransferase family protein n=1 Tax=Alloprevotella sp. OH1205_COT-284 TaxID=2491043 RepID=UPI000F5FE81D|nr:nucleotidyltransferase family protein [Alloprevotella sp. OH1205_COT-284]RRD76630.1 nucleotidyltransferase family protein [Alloprevotella sp. OH1205_COT-284]
MRAMIFAAGLGTRLRPLTDTLPKALVPVGGRPLIDITIEHLKQAGVTEFVVNIHHFAKKITDHLSESKHGVKIIISDESDCLLDTGGGLKKALPLFSSDSRPILIHNVDILSNADLASFYSGFHNAEAHLLVSSRPTKRYLLFDTDMRLVGWTNLETGEVRSPYSHLRVEDCQKFAFSGIHCISPDIADFMDGYPEKFSITQFYIDNCHRLTIRGCQVPDLRLLDVGKQETIRTAEEFLKTVR